MRYFPVFLDLDGKRAVVIGGGEEALRKIRLLLKTSVRIEVVARELVPELAAEPRVNWIAREYEPELLKGAGLVYSTDAALNSRVAEDARALGIPVNVVDRPDISTFIVPSIVDRDPVVVAIGTEGTAPILGQGLRARIDAMLPPALGALARAGAGLRSQVADRIPAGNRRRSFWYRFFFGEVRDAYMADETVNYLAGVEQLLGSESVPATGRVSFVGGGGGQADDLTLKGHRKLQEADVIVHDLTVSGAILEMARRDAVRIAVEGKLFDGTDAVLIREARAGRHAVRLSSGSASLEERIAVAAEGIAFENVSGVVHEEAETAPFPVNEDIRNAVLRAVS